ncbi:MAG: hypothetical protein J7621_26660 [Niastella sp.]|nr:hypothetical protein [Niastella sp.]
MNIVLVLITCLKINNLEQIVSVGQTDTIEYYRNIDLINLEPQQRIGAPDNYPHVKVTKDTAGVKKMEVFFNNKRKAPIKTYDRISFKGLKAYRSNSGGLGWTSIDTLITFNNSMIEFRACYSTTIKRLNEQTVLYYTPAGKDSIQFSYLTLINLVENPHGYQAADTSLQVFNIDTNEKYVSLREDLSIVKNNDRIKLVCRTRRTPWCKTGYHEQLSYPFIISFYWSLFNAPYWEIGK